jgi:hypothetical protein
VDKLTPEQAAVTAELERSINRYADAFRIDGDELILDATVDSVRGVPVLRVLRRVRLRFSRNRMAA